MNIEMKKTLFFILAMLSMATNVLAQMGQETGLKAEKIWVEGCMQRHFLHYLHLDLHNPTDSVCTMKDIWIMTKVEGYNIEEVNYFFKGTSLEPDERKEVVITFLPRVPGEDLEYTICTKVAQDMEPEAILGTVNVTMSHDHVEIPAELSISGSTDDNGAYFLDSDSLNIEVAVTNPYDYKVGIVYGVELVIKERIANIFGYKTREVKDLCYELEANTTYNFTVGVKDLSPAKKYSAIIRYKPFAAGKDVECCEPVYFTVTDNTSGIESVNATENQNAQIFDLQGKRMAGSIDALPAGVYLVNGKKVVKQ